MTEFVFIYLKNNSNTLVTKEKEEEEVQHKSIIGTFYFCLLSVHEQIILIKHSHSHTHTQRRLRTYHRKENRQHKKKERLFCQ